MMNDFDDDIDMPSLKQKKAMYVEFFQDFREYLMEYVRESVVELKIADVSVTGTVKLFEGYPQGKARIKNQGGISCFVTTASDEGYRLDPGEVAEFFVNSPVSVTTLSGTTTIGFIKS